MLTLTKEQQDAVRSAGRGAVRVTNPETHSEYVIVPADVFDQLVEPDDQPALTRAEQLGLLAAAGRRAGWDDPEMDVYDALDPRKK
ncbi:MAG: hypothetical protein IT428_11030 [Planctomycetaceae bacterium]|nr:hypothetical protein [Planctomycetaceae bacterium]